MAVRTGTASQVDASAASGSTSVTVPADATAAVAFWSHYDGTGSTLSTLTLGGNSFVTQAEQGEESVAGESGVGVAVLTDLPGTGSQTLAWAWSAGGARSEGGGVFIVWLKAVDLADPVTDAAIDSQTGGPSAISVTVTSGASDLILAMCQSFTGTNPTIDGTVFIDNVTVNSEVYDVSEVAVAGATTDVAGNGDYATIAAVSIKDAPASGRSAVVTWLRMLAPIPTPVTTVSIGQALETDTATQLAKHYAVGQAQETDAARALAKNIARSTETDSAQAVTSRHVYTVGQANESDTAGAIAETGPDVYVLGQASETDAAQQITTRHLYAVQHATESDAAQSLALIKYAAVGQAAETDSAQAVTRRKLYAVAQATETDTSQAVFKPKVVILGQPSELDSAQRIDEVGPDVYLVSQAEEVDSAQPLTRRKLYAVGLASEADAAGSLADRFSIDQAAETDAAQAFTAHKIRAIGQASETDTAGTVVDVGPDVYQIGMAEETDEATHVMKPKRRSIGLATESDSVPDAIATQHVYPIGQVEEGGGGGGETVVQGGGGMSWPAQYWDGRLRREEKWDQQPTVVHIGLATETNYAEHTGAVRSSRVDSGTHPESEAQHRAVSTRSIPDRAVLTVPLGLCTENDNAGYALSVVRESRAQKRRRLEDEMLIGGLL